MECKSKKDGTTDILKIANFDIIGLNEVEKEVILDDYTSFIAKDGDKITCQLLCKNEIKVKEMWCNKKGYFIAVEIDDKLNKGCIIIVTYINPTDQKKEWREDTLESLNELILGMKDEFATWKKILMDDFNFDFWEENYKKEKNKYWSQNMFNLEHDLTFKSVENFSHKYKNDAGKS